MPLDFAMVLSLKISGLHTSGRALSLPLDWALQGVQNACFALLQGAAATRRRLPEMNRSAFIC
jgi:hypothetical protein